MSRVRLSTRFRVAVAAALTTAIALGGGAVWFVQSLENNVSEQAGEFAAEHVDGLAALITALGSPTKVKIRDNTFGLFEVVDRQGHVVLSCPNGVPGNVPLLAAPPYLLSAQAYWVPDRTFDLVVPGSLTGTFYTDPCIAYAGRAMRLRVEAMPILNQEYVVYAAGDFSLAGQSVVDKVRQELTVGVPLAVLLVAAVAWFAVRGSLRPVAAITAKVGEINATDLRERVPVPKTGDEITELATRMNAMLGRVSESVNRQQRFVADASHELRTPLTSMRTQLEVLFAHSDRIDWRQATHNVALDVVRMQDLVADLLLLGRLEAQAPVPPDEVDLTELVEECLVGRPNITLTAQRIVVLGRRVQLSRLVGNLLDNAARHAASTVTVSIGLDGPWAVVTVADDGPGIPVEDRSRVFDRFVRLDEARDQDSGGSGLGLAIVRDIAIAHGGTVTVTDNGPGARFVVRLPAVKVVPQ